MLVVTALGGNALLRRGEPMTAENQRHNVRIAAQALAPVAAEHQLVIGHGNGPQVGLLALQGAAYTTVEAYPLDVLGAQTEGMIGYIIEQDLASELLARDLDADLFIMLTDAEAVYTDWGKPTQKAIRRASPSALSAMSFAAGSMGPKVDAACRFVAATGKKAAIGALADLGKIIAGEAGTTVSSKESAILYGT